MNNVQEIPWGSRIQVEKRIKVKGGYLNKDTFDPHFSVLTKQEDQRKNSLPLFLITSEVYSKFWPAGETLTFGEERESSRHTHHCLKRHDWQEGSAAPT